MNRTCFPALLGLALIWLLGVGCQLPFQGDAAPGEPEVAESTLEVEEGTPSPVSTAPPQVASSTPITLTFWTTEEFSPQGEETGSILADQFRAFQEANPQITLDYVLKKPYGRGGMLNLLLTTSQVVPGLLPDLVAIDADELKVLAERGLVQPLDDLVAAELKSDLFPFARDSCSFEGHLMGVLYQADVELTAYNTTALAAPPTTWSDVSTDTVRYVFPTGGVDGEIDDAFLIQYLALGGQLVDEQGQPALDRWKLVETFRFYQEGNERHVLDLDTLEECWGLYKSGGTGVTNVLYSQYQADAESLSATALTSVPTKDGQPRTISRGWALAITTLEPTRRAVAAKFIEWLLNPSNTAAWNRSAGTLPTRGAAIGVEPGDVDVEVSWRELLEGASVRPSGEAHKEMFLALQEGLEDILAGNASPLEAALRMPGGARSELEEER